MSTKVLTNLYVVQDARVLLGMKKRGFGAGKWNGFGGKVEEGETIEAAADRELREEAGIAVTDKERIGIIKYKYAGKPNPLEVHVFRASRVVGEPTETEEMVPRWFSADELPLASMWADDPFWFKFLLSGERFEASFSFADDMQTIEAASVVTLMPYRSPSPAPQGAANAAAAAAAAAEEEPIV